MQLLRLIAIYACRWWQSWDKGDSTGFAWQRPQIEVSIMTEKSFQLADEAMYIWWRSGSQWENNEQVLELWFLDENGSLNVYLEFLFS